MEIKIVLCFVGCLLLSELGFNVAVSGEYELKHVGNWTEASIKCTLAMPRINYSKDGHYTVDMTLDSLKDGQEAWSGYVMTYEVFQYMGCVRVSDILVDHEKISTVHKPGHCYSACRNYSLFGLRSTTGSDCFCFKSGVGGIKDTRNACDKRCDDGNFLCGNSGALSLYTKANLNRITELSEKCLAYKLDNNESIKWENCSELLQPLCFKGAANTSLFTHSSKFTWAKAADNCLHRSGYPASVAVNRTSIPGDSKYWTAYIKTLAISEVNSIVNSRPHLYGYIRRDENAFRLEFTENGNNRNIGMAICLTGLASFATPQTPATQTKTIHTSGTGTPTTTVISNPATSDSLNIFYYPNGLTSLATPQTPATQTKTIHTSGTGTPSTSVISKPATSGTTSTSTSTLSTIQTSLAAASNSNADNNNLIGVYVAVPLVVVCVIVVIAVAFLCRKRRSRVPKESDPIISTRNNLTYNKMGNDVGYVNVGMEHDIKNTFEPGETGAQHSDQGDRTTGIYEFAKNVEVESSIINKPENSYFVLENVNELSKDPETDQRMATPAEPNGQLNRPAENIFNTAHYDIDVHEYDHIGRKYVNPFDAGHYDTTGSREPDDSDYDMTGNIKQMNDKIDEDYAHVVHEQDVNNLYSKVAKKSSK